MRCLPSFVTALLFVTPWLAAQDDVHGALSTHAASGVFANRQHAAVRTGTVADPEIQLAIRDGDHANSASLAALSIVRTTRGPAISGRFAVHGVAADGHVCGTLGGDPLVPGAQSYALVIRSRTPTAGDVHVSFDGAVRNGAGAEAAVTVGDSSVRFHADGQRHRHSFAGVRVGAEGATILIRIGGQAHGANGSPAGYEARLEVTFVEAAGSGCTVSFGELSCTEGGVLRGSAVAGTRGGVLSLQLSGALHDAIGVTFISGSGATVPFHGTHCVLFVDPIVHALFLTDAHGAAATRVEFPLQRGDFFVQQATLLISPRGVALGTSNTLRVTCH